MIEVKIQATFEYQENDMHGNDEEAKKWFRDILLCKDEKLDVYSQEVGDFIGKLDDVTIVEDDKIQAIHNAAQHMKSGGADYLTFAEKVMDILGYIGD